MCVYVSLYGPSCLKQINDDDDDDDDIIQPVRSMAQRTSP